MEFPRSYLAGSSISCPSNMHRFNRRMLAASGKSSSSPRETQRQNVCLIILSMVLITTVSSILVLFYYGQDSQLLKNFKVENVQQLEMVNNQHSTKLSSSKPDFSNKTFESRVSSESVFAATTSKSLRKSLNDKNLSFQAKEVLSKPTAIKTEPLVNTASKYKSGHTLSLPLTLVSLNKPVMSDVRGNLGPATVVTNEKVEDWLQDRWQAARNMQGEPIPGEHWIEVDLEEIFSVEKIVIDWEQAYSDQWSIMVRPAKDSPWKRLCVSKEATTIEKNKMHVIQEVFPSKNVNLADSAHFVKLVIHRPSTIWGSSIWRFQIWGRPHKTE